MPRAVRPKAPPQPVGETLRFLQRLWQLVHALDVRSKRMAKQLGVTSPQRIVVRVIGMTPGISATEISAILGLHPSTLTGVLKRLVAQKWIQRTTDVHDRRVARFQLTPAGNDINREHRGTVEAAVRRVLGRSDAKAIATASKILDQLASELARED